MKNKIYFLLVSIMLVFALGCKKQTQNRLLGKWDRAMVSNDQSQNYGHRNLISEKWDFRDFKYVYIISTLSGQAGAGPGVSLDSLPIIVEERRRYEIIKKKEVHIIQDVANGEVKVMRIEKLGGGILKMTEMTGDVVGNTYDFYRSELE